MTPLAWLGALAIGLTLGLLGSGGSILTVPVLIYVVGVPEKAAITESLAIVGLIAGGGVLPYIHKRLVSWSTVLLFSLPGMFGAYLGALAATRLSSRFQLILFGALMLSAAVLMLRSPLTQRDDAPTHADPAASAAPALPAVRSASIETIIVQGFGIGVLTGLVGVGGGFLIVPALVLLVHLPMHMAVGTSLATITLNSAAGFFKHAQQLPALGLHLDWHIVILFASVGVVGSLTGSAIAAHVPHERLRRVFGGFLVLMAAFLLWRNTLGH